jgi:hypothetical protein
VQVNPYGVKNIWEYECQSIYILTPWVLFAMLFVNAARVLVSGASNAARPL